MNFVLPSWISCCSANTLSRSCTRSCRLMSLACCSWSVIAVVCFACAARCIVCFLNSKRLFVLCVMLAWWRHHALVFPAGVSYWRVMARGLVVRGALVIGAFWAGDVGGLSMSAIWFLDAWCWTSCACCR